MKAQESMRQNKLALADQIDWCRKIASLSGGSEVKEDGFSYIKDAAIARLCTVFDLEKAQYAETAAAAIRAGIVPNKILTDSLASGEETEEALRRAGFQNYFEQTGMAYAVPQDIAQLPQRSAEQERHIRLIAPGESLEEWVKTFTLAFQGEGNTADLAGLIPLYEQVNEDDRYYFFTYEEDGKTLATSFAFFRSGISGIHSVGTRPEARGRGIASALVKHLLHLAHELGCTECVLQASPMGRPVYERLGFSVGGPIRHWKLELE